MKKPRPTHFPLPNELNYELVHFFPVEYCIRLLRSLNPPFSHGSNVSKNNYLNRKLKQQQQPKPTSVYPLGFYISGRRHVRERAPWTIICNFLNDLNNNQDHVQQNEQAIQLPQIEQAIQMQQIEQAIRTIVQKAELIVYTSGSGMLPDPPQTFYTKYSMVRIRAAVVQCGQQSEVFNEAMDSISGRITAAHILNACRGLRAHFDSIVELVNLAAGAIPGTIHIHSNLVSGDIPEGRIINGHCFTLAEGLLNEYEQRYVMLRSETGMGHRPAM